MVIEEESPMHDEQRDIDKRAHAEERATTSVSVADEQRDIKKKAHAEARTMMIAWIGDEQRDIKEKESAVELHAI